MMIFSMAYFPSNLAPEDLFARTYSKRDEDLKSILLEDSSEGMIWNSNNVFHPSRSKCSIALHLFCCSVNLILLHATSTTYILDF